jgi:hypothetical protein
MRTSRRVDLKVWEHVGTGFYRRRDGRGIVNHVGPHDWAAMADMGQGMVPVGNGHTAEVATGFADRALSSE